MKIPGRIVWTPHRREWRRALAALFVGTLMAGVLFFLGVFEASFVRDWLPVPAPRVRRAARPRRPPATQVVLAHRVEALRALVGRAQAGPLLATGPRRAVIAVDEGLVAVLLRAHLPATHVIDERFRVHLVGAQVEFEDGMALIRLDGRVSLADRPESEVYADLAVFGDLGLLPHQPSRDTLRGRVRIFGVEARHVAVGVRVREVDRLIEQVSQARLEDLARLGPELDIPVRRVHVLEIPGVGPDGPVRIEPATLATSLTLSDARAFAGRLWLGVEVSIGDAAAPSPAGPPAMAALDPSPAGPPNAAKLRAELGALQRVLDQRLAADPALAALGDLEADVALMIPSTVVSAVGEEVALRLLDKVVLDLRGIEVEKEGEMRKDTVVGKIRAGRWRLTVNVVKVGGVLRAGTPRLRLSGGQRIAVELPVRIEEGRGQADMTFDWDSTGIANLVCRDFTASDRVEATVPADTHLLRGTVRLEAARDVLHITPEADRRYRIGIVPTGEAWAQARRVLAEQDRFWRCGLGLDPEAVMAQVRRIVERGVNVRLPARLFRTISVAIAPPTDLDVAGTRVTVRPAGTRLDLGPDRVVVATRLEVEMDVRGERRTLGTGPAAPPPPPR